LKEKQVVKGIATMLVLRPWLEGLAGIKKLIADEPTFLGEHEPLNGEFASVADVEFLLLSAI
jgi:hypothetical protein